MPRIVVKKGVDRQAIGAEQAKLDAAKAASYSAMRDLAAQRAAVGAKKGEGRVGGIHRDALFAAVQSEGPEVLSADARGWWDDQKRRNPWMCADGAVPGTDSINGRRNRLGNVSERYFRGKWWIWDDRVGDWVENPKPRKKGIR